MYALVKFYDDVHYVCTQKCIFPTKSRDIKVKYSDGYRYSATIIAKNNDKRLLETIVKNINTNVPNVTINPRKKYKTRDINPEKNIEYLPYASSNKSINCDDPSATRTTDNSKKQCNLNKFTDVSVSYDNAINATTTCDMNATNNGTTCYMSTTNNATANCKESYDYEKNIEKSCDINKIINLDEGGVLNFETCIDSSEIDCQKDILVFSFNDDINETINCDYTSAFKETDNSKKQCNLKKLADVTPSSDNITNATTTCDMSAINNRTIICTKSHNYERNIEKSSSCVPINQTINSDERSALNIETYVEFSKPDYQKEMLDNNQNILVNKQIEYVELSPIYYAVIILEVTSTFFCKKNSGAC
ncbi:uncharacterized protein LOC114932932 [Nylanderia fulva]|uniref:uncharacterized protein LOC114932932 n=2 Tax=Nylanderia fulva TaxID=613905 RepID=UPI0010FB5925|nr:uncharacterized protein LOC114932932 [Nylanderia fulva]